MPEIKFVLARSRMPGFARYIGIRYSGAATPDESLKDLRVYQAKNEEEPAEIKPASSLKKYWTRRRLAEWLVDELAKGPPTIVGIDHAFSFPIWYFEMHDLKLDWSEFLDDFARHWPTGDPHVYVDFVRDGNVGNGEARNGNIRWQRVSEKRAGSSKSVFQFDGQGAIGKTTHSGLPWLRFIRNELGSLVHFWPFDGWEIPEGRTAVVESDPSLWRAGFPREGRNPGQHDAYCIAASLQHVDQQGRLSQLLQPGLPSLERRMAEVEGWILGVE